MNRKIIGNDAIGFKDYSKSSRGFIQDVSTNNYIVPEYIKLSNDDALSLFRGNEWVNSTINHIIDDCTKILVTIMPRDKNMKTKPRHNSAIRMVDDFLWGVNEQKENFNSLREKFIKDMLIYGRGTMEKVFKGSVLNELYCLRASTIDVNADKYGTIPESRAYIQTGKDGREVYFDKNEILWSVFRELSGSYYGEKPLDTLANAVASDILRTAYNSNFFVNGAEASGVLALKGMGKTELGKFRQFWRDNHKGVKNAHKMVAVNVPVEYVRMAITNRDLEFSEYGKELMMKIFAVFAMQPFIMGIVDGTSGKLNSEQQVQIYKDNALKPILRKESIAYTKEILHDGFGMTDFMFGFEGIDLADSVKQAEIDRMDIDAGVLTINEVRRRRGLQPVPWGDTPISVLPGGNQIDPDTGRIIPPSQQGDGKKPSAKKPKEEKEEKGYDSFMIDVVSIAAKGGLVAESLVGVNVKKYSQSRSKRSTMKSVLIDVCERYGSGDVKMAEVIDILESGRNK